MHMEHTHGPNGDSGSSLAIRRVHEEAPLAPRMKYADAIAEDYLEQADSEGLFDYGRTLWRNKATVLIAALLGALAGFLFSLPQTPIFQGRTTLEIETFNENYLNLREVSPTTATSRYATEFDISTQVKILESESLLTKVVEKLKLHERPEFAYQAGRLSVWRKALGLPPAAQVPPLERAIEIASQNFHVEPSRKTRIVEIFSDWPDPRLAADFANMLAETFIENNLEARWKSAQRSGVWLTRQLGELRINLEKSEERLQSYARVSGLLFTSEKDSVSEEKLRQLQAELSKAQADRISTQSRFEMAGKGEPGALPGILDNGPLRGYQVRLTDLRRELAQINSIFTPSHYKFRGVRVQIEELEKAIETERSNVLDRIRNEYETVLRREKLLEQDYAAQTQLVSEQGGKAIQYNIYKREVETNRQIYDSLLQRVKEAAFAATMRASNIRVIDPAKPPRRAHKPNHAVNSALGLLGGIFLGIAFVFVSERADRTLRQPGESTNYLHVPELGVIPASVPDSLQRSKGGRKLAAGKRRKSLPSSSILAEPGATGPNGGEAARGGAPETVELTAWQQKPTLVAESFRAALTSILFTGQNGSHPRLLVVTSPSPGEGKTTVVINLAICLAEINRKVLLIDADMRKPRVHKVFGVPNQWGLSDLLHGAGSLDQGVSLEDLAVKTQVPGLYVLPSGSPAHSIPNLLHSPRTSELLQRAREEFDSVLIDTPPMMQISDARVLGQMSDAVILVLRAGQTTRGTAKAAAARFLEDGTHLLGTILNSWDPKTNGYGYYDSYRYYDYYYSDREERQEEAT